ncbi:MAG: hypothetical protein J6J44_09865 [Lachnospiraceae bacterium]|nr:hypothetical protein [Lachnospiraceae bacterium]
MSILKKATIALTVAVSLFLSTPVFTHAAAADTCRHEHLSLREEHRFQGTETITYTYWVDIDGDYEGEYSITDDCRHAVFDVYVKYRCDTCNKAMSDWKYSYTYYTSHEEKTCPKR